MSNKLRIGVLGAAKIARRSIIPAFIADERCKLVAIGSKSSYKSEELNSDLNCRVFDNYEDVLKQNLDAVYIPLPNSEHSKWINLSLEQNLHVLVEKSMATDYNDVVLLNERADNKKLALIENFQFRFHSQLKYIVDLISSGALGDIRQLRSTFGFPPFDDLSNIRYFKELGGGALLDAGAYPVKLCQTLLGTGLRVKASTLNYQEKFDVDIWGGAYLEQKSTGINCQIGFGFDNSYQNTFEIWGSQGYLKTDRIFTARSNHTPSVLVESKKHSKTLELPTDDHFSNMINHFINVVQGSAGPEYAQNIDQARILRDIKNAAN